MLVGVRADQDVDTGAGPGCDAIDRTRGEDVAIMTGCHGIRLTATS